MSGRSQIPENKQVLLPDTYGLLETLCQAVKDLRPCMCLAVKSAVIKGAMSVRHQKKLPRPKGKCDF